MTKFESELCHAMSFYVTLAGVIFIPSSLAAAAFSMDALSAAAIDSLPWLADPFWQGLAIGAFTVLCALVVSRLFPSGPRSTAPSKTDSVSEAQPARLESTSTPSFWPGVQELGRMFRRWDADKDGRLSLQEFQLGIRSLGLEIPSERSIASLMHEMDADHGGFIDEDEFVGTLRRYTRESLQQRMLEAVGAKPSPTQQINVQFYVLGKTVHSGVFETRTVESVAEVAPALRACRARAADLVDDAVVWVDLEADTAGAADAALDALTVAAALPLSLDSALDYSFAGECRSARDDSADSTQHKSQSNSALSPRGKSQSRHKHHSAKNHVAHLVLNATSLSVSPIDSSASQHSPTLVSDADYARQRPRLITKHVHIFVAGAKLLITVRPAKADRDADNSKVSAVWNDILTELRMSPSLLAQGAVQTNAVGLCAKLCAELIDFNYTTYDLLKDWQRALKAAIEATTASSSSNQIRALVAAHLFDCEAISQEVLFASAPVLQLLKSLSEDDHGVLDNDSDGIQHDSLDRSNVRNTASNAASWTVSSPQDLHRAPQLRRASSSVTLVPTAQPSPTSSIALAASNSLSATMSLDKLDSSTAFMSNDSTRTASLLKRHFAPAFVFSAAEHAASFSQAAHAQARFDMLMHAIVERCETLAERHTSAQTQMTNATLFRLSALQGITFPLTLLTGLYGMNFVHMPELQWKYSYLFFLCAAAVYLFFASRWYFQQLKALGLTTK